MVEASPEIKKYFESINQEITICYDIAKEARLKGLDPEDEVPIPLAKNMAERVVGLISVVAPQILGTNITSRILELENEFGHLDWRVGFKIAEEVAKEIFCKFDDQQQAIETGIRVGFAYLTLGIVSAPLEGFIGIKIKKRNDGKEYFALQYAGPIRAAGGTAASTSVILADYVRVKMGYSPYDPSEQEISRYNIEVHDYHERVTNLQYHPSDEEIKFMVAHLPVEVDGDPTEQIEVSNYKDLPRIETNMIRGGVALVLAEGLCQKSPKLWKRLAKWGKSFDLEWEWLKDFIALKEQIHTAHASKDPQKEEGKEQKKTVKPNNTFLMDMVAGRPILTHPMAVGGFRLRYGRTRMTGFSASAIHPATMIVLDKYIAIGTQLKNERPGKGATVTVCETIEGPIVRLNDGSVLQLKTEEEAKIHFPHIDQVIFLGDILFNYGDFSENGQNFCPVGYCPEWWALEVEKEINLKYNKDYNSIASKLTIAEPRLKEMLEQYFYLFPTWKEAKSISENLNVPLHPNYTLYWKLIPANALLILKEWFKEGKIKKEGIEIKKIILPYSAKNELYQKSKQILDDLGCFHQVINKESVILESDEANLLSYFLSFKTQQEMENIALDESILQNSTALDYFNQLRSIKMRDKAGTFIGARMGRPEKAKMRQMTGSPQVMFPVAEEGDRLRSFQSALESNKINSVFPCFYCDACKKEMIYPHCEECNAKCSKRYHCRSCGDLEKDTCRHGKGVPYKVMDLDIKYYFEKAKERLNEKLHPDLIKGVRGTSNKEHIVEHLAKGILRAKHLLYVNKDGTIRYDCTELPITHFKPKEIKTSIKKLKEIGYKKDIYGKDLIDENQLLEIKPQDIILPNFNSLDESAGQVLSRVANFIDDLLIKFYHLPPYYNIQKEEDLVGHLIIGLAPHISAGLIGRIIGFSETQGLLTHPMYHAGMRRDCLIYDTFISIYDGNQWNITKIGDLVESFNPNQQLDSFGTLGKKMENYSTLSYNKKTNQIEIVPILNITKHQPTPTLKIKTENGREIEVTEDHIFYTLTHNTIQEKRASELTEEDILIQIQNIKISAKGLDYDKKISYTRITSIQKSEENKVTYCLNVAKNHNFIANNFIVHNCDGDEACAMLLMDALLNFSRQYLPERRGAKTMDAPLVLTSVLNPKEIDDQVHGIDVVWRYPLELYEAAEEMKAPWEVKYGEEKKKIEQLGDRLGTALQYEQFGFTHPVDNFNKGVQCSAYKIKPSMEEKLLGQMDIAKRVRAVNMDDVARLVIHRHFLKDIKGNFKKFSMQQFRCVKCNEKYRRPPLGVKCSVCGGKLIFTISEGSVVKYLGPSLMLCDQYDFSPYLKQTLTLLKYNIDSFFGKEKEKQVGLGSFMG